MKNPIARLLLALALFLIGNTAIESRGEPAASSDGTADRAVGRVRFNFNGQPWQDVLQWLADIGGHSLDWQELPEGEFNLTSPKPYSVAEARNVVNRHLLTRGYVLLLSDNVLNVVPREGVDPSMIPNATEVDLYNRQAYDLVKVTFQLAMDADANQVASEVQKLLSEQSTVVPLPASRRVLAIDTVQNLRLVSRLIADERLAKASHPVPRRFKLKYARAERVIAMVYAILGVKQSTRMSQGEMDIRQQELQLMWGAQDNGADITKMLKGNGSDVFMVYNAQENSILVNANPVTMRVIEDTIAFLDIPSAGTNDDLATTNHTRRTPKTYRLKNVDPESLLKTLEEIGDLQPLTDLRADNGAGILFARATQEDHEKIAELVADLDTGGAKFEVFQLRRHAADALAGTVKTLLGSTEQPLVVTSNGDQPNPRDTEMEEDDFDNGRGRPATQEADKLRPYSFRLRIDADVRRNRLLVRGSDGEIQQLRELLAKIGELPGERVDGVAGPATRTLRPMDPSATAQLIEKLRQAWPAIGGNAELLIDGQPASSGPAIKPKPAERTRSTSNNRGADERFRTVSQSLVSDTGSGVPAEPRAAITTAPDGSLVITSDDPEIAERLHTLAETLAPREPRFKTFAIKEQQARYIAWNLTDYFRDLLRDQSQSPGLSRPTGGEALFGERSTATLSRPGGAGRLRIMHDSASNTVLVTGASPDQLVDIEQLIRRWDVEPNEKSIAKRKTTVVKLRHSKADVVAKALKEVYRDLLSSRDKEFSPKEGVAGSSFIAARTTAIEYDINGVANGDAPRVSVGFDGALSIGVDSVSNVLVISADTQLLAGVVEVVRFLDEQARRKSVVAVEQLRPDSARAVLNFLGAPAMAGKVSIKGTP